MNLKLSEIASFLDAKVIGQNDDIVIKSYSINSKDIKDNTLFIPLKGQRFDGHDFIDEAVKNKAASFITQRDVGFYEVPYLKVDDTLCAMQSLAGYCRDRLKDTMVIGVTGSVGKTTTKEYIYSVLSTSFRAYKNEGNLNNHIGLPYALLNIPQDVVVSVFEMGMSNFGEISLLSKIAKPNIAVITNIGIAHIENLGSRYNIFRAKKEIEDGMQDDGLVIINNDNDILNKYKAEFRKRIITVGVENEADFRASNIKRTEDGFEFEVNSYKYSIKSVNYHDVYNSLFAICVGHILGIENHLIQNGILNKARLKRRFEIIKKGFVTVIDDTYNANTASMISAIDALCEFEGKKMVVLGDMLELGQFSEDEHRKVGRYLAKKPVDVALFVGKHSYYMYEEAKNNQGLKVFYSEYDDVINILLNELDEGFVILFKASRGMSFDRLVDEFLRRIQM